MPKERHTSLKIENLLDVDFKIERYLKLFMLNE